jgi:hypothetical protein
MVEDVVLDQLVSQLQEKTGPDDYLKLCEILIEAIPLDRKQFWVGKVLTYLAYQTMQSIKEGNGTPRISTKAIHVDLGGNPKQQPSAWLSPIWDEIEERHYPEIEPTLIDECRRAGLTTYPTLEKDHGKPAYYRIGVKPVPASSEEPMGVDEVLPKYAIRYKRDLSLTLSWPGKLFFSTGLRWTPFKRYSYVMWQLMFLFAVAAFDLLLWLLLWFSKPPLSGQELVVISMAIGMPIGAYWHLRDIFRLFEDRILIAPDWMLAIKEFGATVEINRSKYSDEDSTILVQRYTSICPVCGWMIKLDRGEPDFPRRIVGRCEEHPREHVFSFDRMTKQGTLLRRDIALPSETTPQTLMDAC